MKNYEISKLSKETLLSDKFINEYFLSPESADVNFVEALNNRVRELGISIEFEKEKKRINEECFSFDKVANYYIEKERNAKYNKAKQEAPFEIEELTKETILQEGVFAYMLSIEDDIQRMKINLKLEERADSLGVKSQFLRMLKTFQKRYNSNIKYNHVEIGEMMLKNFPMGIYNNELYIYINGVYTNNQKLINQHIIKCYQEATINMRKEVTNYLSIQCDNNFESLNDNYINFKNGLYDIRNKKLLDHTSSIFTINQLPIDYDNNPPKVKEIDEFLNRITCNNENRKQAILEIIGYSMTTSIKKQKSFIFYGKKAGNGKSTLLNILEYLNGKNNTSHVSLENLDNNKFSLAEMIGKNLNISSEMTKEYLKDVSLFKMIVTGDTVASEKKFKDRVDIKPYAKLILTANELPKVADKTNGFYRRLHIILFDAEFSEEEKNNFKFEKLISKGALQYLAYISLMAYINMGNNFSNYEESAEILNQYKIESNNILAYLASEELKAFLNKNSTTIYRSNVYSDYKLFCEKNQFNALGNTHFYKEIRELKIVIESKYNGIPTFKFIENWKEKINLLAYP